MKLTLWLNVCVLIFGLCTHLNAQRLQYAVGTTMYASTQHQARAFYEIDDRLRFGRICFDVASVSLVRNNLKPSEYNISLNPVFGLLYGISSPISTALGQALSFPQLLGNFRFAIPVSGKNNNLVIGQVTDYFYLNNKPEVLSETTLGFHATIGNLLIGVNGYYPLIHSVIKPRKLTFALSIGFKSR